MFLNCPDKFIGIYIRLEMILTLDDTYFERFGTLKN